MTDFTASLSRHMEEFVGYGSLDAKVWFLGPEQAGVETVTDASERMGFLDSLDAAGSGD